VCWYEEEPDRLERERRTALALLDDVLFPQTGKDGVFKIVGSVPVRFLDEDGEIDFSFRVRIEYPRDFPPQGLVPTVFDHDCRYAAPDPEGHINDDHGFCLGMRGGTDIDSPAYSLHKLVDYLKVFLLAEYVYQQDKRAEIKTGRPAKWPGPAYSHGAAGLREGLEEKAGQRNALCPCGSGKKFKNCCMISSRQL